MLCFSSCYSEHARCYVLVHVIVSMLGVTFQFMLYRACLVLRFSSCYSEHSQCYVLVHVIVSILSVTF